jgi:hypothetical protein
MAAAGSLIRIPGGRSDAAAWISLADSYRNDYQQLIKKFRPQSSRLNRPTHS